MPRLQRIFIPGCPQHIIQRGNNRQDCFFERNDYVVYLAKLRDAANTFNVKIHAFVLMTNHVHILATANEKYDVSKMMQSLGRFYVHHINKKYGRTGTLWEGRFKSTIIDSEGYLLTVYRYIELNPVRAGMVNSPAAYPWSSYHHNAGNKRIELLTPHTIYLALGGDDNQRKTAYTNLFQSDIPGNEISLFRESTNKAWALSDEPFLEEINDQISRRAFPKARGGDRRSFQFRNNRT